MRRALIIACLVALGLTLLLHATTLAGVIYDGKHLFYGGMAAILVVCIPGALAGGGAGPKTKSPAARARQRLINVVMTVSVIYVFGLGVAAMTPEQRAELRAGESVSLWRGERDITVPQARMMSAFPIPFFAACALILWDRRKREREALEP